MFSTIEWAKVGLLHFFNRYYFVLMLNVITDLFDRSDIF